MLNLLLLTTAGFCAGYCFGAFLGTTKQKKEIIQLIKELEEDNAKMMNSFYLRDKCRRHSKPNNFWAVFIGNIIHVFSPE